MLGSRLSHYTIFEPLGAGGMGVVYRARDERLEREVAIKVLPAGALADEAARRQFRKEALALSRLNHPNIATVHDFDFQEGVNFLVLELVSGEPLSERIARGPLPEEKVIRLGEQLAEGLSAAHRELVLHRDIKPANLCVTPDERLKILDFGLAKLVQPPGDLTKTETVSDVGSGAGTVPYMSPEQLRGEPLDGRSDIYAAGAVLYEMACGRRPFPHESPPAVMGAILHEQPTPPRKIVPRLSADLERVILRCLEKEPRHRYQNVAELALDLRSLASPSRRRRIAGPHPTRRRVPVALAAAGLVIVAVFLAVRFNVGGLRDRVFPWVGTPVASLAILPLLNVSGDPEQEFFADGMTDELISRFAQIGALRVISRTSSMQYKGASKPLRRIAKELGVRLVLEGSVLRAGNAVRITAQLIDAARERPLWAERFEGDARDVIRLQSEVAQAIVQQVRVKLTSEESKRVAAARAVNPEAHETYLRARHSLNQFTVEEQRRAVELFQRAIDLDPGYAPAHAGLAETYYSLSSIHLPASEAMPRARAAALAALNVDPGLASAHAVLGCVQAFYDWKWKEAEQTFRRAIELGPGEANSHLYYAQMLVIVMGRHEEGASEIEKARTIDPLSPWITAMRTWPLLFSRRFDKTADLTKKLLAVDPQNASLHYVLGVALTMQGQTREGVAELERAYSVDPRPNYLCYVGWARARAGDRAGAQEVLRRIRERAAEQYVQPFVFAIMFASLGEADSAFAYLERGLVLRSEEQLDIRTNVTMDPLRSDPRFRSILRRMNLESLEDREGGLGVSGRASGIASGTPAARAAGVPAYVGARVGAPRITRLG